MPHLRFEWAGDTVEVHWKPDGRPIRIDVVHGDGLVWFYHRDWASPDNRAATLWTTT